MTPPAQQPKEQIYVVTNSYDDSEIKSGEATEFIFSIHFDGIIDNKKEARELQDLLGPGFRIKAIRSRPHPAPAPTAEFSIGYAEGYKEGKRQAREDVLKELLNWAPGYFEYKGQWVVSVEKLKDKIESLRGLP